MRRVLYTALTLFAVAACEDGPTQTFNPSPDGAGNRWNNGNSPGTTDPATQGFNGVQGGQTKQEICTAPQLKTAWSSMLAAAIQPPRVGANLDMAGSDSWEGLTIEQAEKVNCQSANYDSGDNYWGDNGEVFVSYSITTRKIYYLGFDEGYTGAVDFTSRDGKTQYKIANSLQIKSGPVGGALNPMTISWDNDPNTGFATWATPITDALFATFQPGLPAETNCLQNSHCVPGTFGDQGYIFIPALGFGFRVSNVNAPQPTPSTVSYMDQYLEKVMPFSQANPMLKLDALGPQAVVTNLGPNKKTCSLGMGMTYGNLLTDCVQVSGDATKDTSELNKLIGGLSHDTERFAFDLSGVDVNFTDKSLAADDVVKDLDRPAADDTATRFDVDQSTLGGIVNDYAGNDATQAQDYHGTGLVYAEFARLVQQEINATLPAAQRHNLGDAACLTGDPTTFAAGCTGFEGFVVPLDPAKISDANLKKLALLPSNALVDAIKNGGGLKPGHQKVLFCDSPGQTNCTTTGDTFSTAFARLVQVMGKGKASTLPPNMQDARFFFQQWATAFIKYMMVETPTGTATALQVQNAPLDPDALFFDSEGAGQYELSEYVDRRFVTASQDPTDIQITADVKNGIFDDYQFSRDLYRGEQAIYTALQSDKTKPIGSENALLANIFGSPVLTGGWHAHSNATAYECATGAKTVAQCEGEGPPTDANGVTLVDSLGHPILAPYQVALGGGSLFKLGGTSAVSVKQTYPAIESAMITYNPPGSGGFLGSGLTFLVPYLPKQPGVGFPIALTGTIDKFVSTFQTDFSGTTISANVDYDFVNPKNPDAGISFLAVETTDFLGSVFMCQDTNTLDLLTVRMYTPAASILNWLAAHPGSSDDCGIVVRYSPYNNFPDYISSLTNGVRLGITQGGGFGRVVDVTLFTPGQ